MNAPDKLASLLTLTREPFPASRKTYITGSRDDLRVPLREVSLTNGEVVSLYDTSGPYSDPTVEIDVTRGLPDVRTAWIEARGDTESYVGRSHQVLDDGVKGEARQAIDADRIDALRQAAAALQRTPRRAKAGANRSGNVTQMHYARRGIVTAEMAYVRCARTASASGWPSTWPTRCASSGCAATRWAPASPPSSRPSSCATKWRAAAPSSRPISTTPKSSRW